MKIELMTVADPGIDGERVKESEESNDATRVGAHGGGERKRRRVTVATEDRLMSFLILPCTFSL